MSWRTKSNLQFDKTILVRPLIVNKNKNLKNQYIEIPQLILLLNKVETHEKILIPVGTAMIIVAAVKYARESISILTVNIWCAHTKNPKKPIPHIAQTIL